MRQKFCVDVVMVGCYGFWRNVERKTFGEWAKNSLLNMYVRKNEWWSETILVECVKLRTGNKIKEKWIVPCSLLHAEWISAFANFWSKIKFHTTKMLCEYDKVASFSGLNRLRWRMVNAKWNKGRNIGIKNYTCSARTRAIDEEVKYFPSVS